MSKKYALYKGDILLASGTIVQIADKVNTNTRNIKRYGTTAYKRILAKNHSKPPKNYSDGCRILIPLDD